MNKNLLNNLIIIKHLVRFIEINSITKLKYSNSLIFFFFYSYIILLKKFSQINGTLIFVDFFDDVLSESFEKYLNTKKEE